MARLRSRRPKAWPASPCIRFCCVSFPRSIERLTRPNNTDFKSSIEGSITPPGRENMLTSEPPRFHIYGINMMKSAAQTPLLIICRDVVLGSILIDSNSRVKPARTSVKESIA